MTNIAVELSGIRKTFGGFVALDDVSFTACYGQVHALLGENGAGKSSLMNILSGLYSPEAGSIQINAMPLSFSGPKDAVRAGVGMIHQHFKLVDKFTARENVLLALAVDRKKPNTQEVHQKILRLASRLHCEIDPNRIVGTMSVAERQRVEIIKALALGSRILILDEPTAVLTEKEASSLYEVMAEIAATGTCVIIVTHKLRDVKAVAAEAMIMRQGRVVATVDPKVTTTAELTTLTVGTEIPEPRRSTKPSGDCVLRIEGLSGRDDAGPLKGTSLQVRSGEIYGIAGVGGNGQTELVDALSGVGDIKDGQILVGTTSREWTDATRLSSAQLLDLGLAWIPADRQNCALATRLSVQDNYAIAHIRSGIGSRFWINRRAIRKLASQAVAAADVHGVRSLAQWVGLLSGGNAQKLVVERELSRSPKIIVAHSPCRGLDVRAAAAVHGRLLEARDNGIAVILISEDLDEVLAISDRIGVMSNGRIVAEFNAPGDRQAIGDAMVNHV